MSPDVLSQLLRIHLAAFLKCKCIHPCTKAISLGILGCQNITENECALFYALFTLNLPRKNSRYFQQYICGVASPLNCQCSGSL